MKNLIAQIIFFLILILCTWSSGCTGIQTGNNNVDSISKDKDASLKHLNTEHEGVTYFHDLIISTKCWSSMMDNIAYDFAEDGARDLLVKACPNLNTPISNAQSRASRFGIVTCVQLVISKNGSICN